MNSKSSPGARSSSSQLIGLFALVRVCGVVWFLGFGGFRVSCILGFLVVCFCYSLGGPWDMAAWGESEHTALQLAELGLGASGFRRWPPLGPVSAPSLSALANTANDLETK